MTNAEVRNFDYDSDPDRFRSGVKAVERYGLLGDVHSEVAERIAREDLWPALDMGCGTGVLAMALVRLGVSQVLAADVDPVAIAVTRANARANRTGRRLRAVIADSYAAPVLRAAAPFELVVANILARPLVAMSPALANALAPGGTAIVSGLLASQQRLVLSAHRANGLILTDRVIRDGWATLTLTKPALRRGRTSTG